MHQMKTIGFLSVLLLFVLSVPVFAAANIEACGGGEASCMSSCCVAAGGTIQADGSCAGETTGDPTAAGDQYSNCVSQQCRPALLSCVAPNSGCSQVYLSCYTSCLSRGSGPSQCDDSCFNTATACVANSTSNSTGSCYGPAVLLTLLPLAVVFVRSKGKG